SSGNNRGASTTSPPPRCNTRPSLPSAQECRAAPVQSGTPQSQEQHAEALRNHGRRQVASIRYARARLIFYFPEKASSNVTGRSRRTACHDIRAELNGRNARGTTFCFPFGRWHMSLVEACFSLPGCPEPVPGSWCCSRRGGVLSRRFCFCGARLAPLLLGAPAPRTCGPARPRLPPLYLGADVILVHNHPTMRSRRPIRREKQPTRSS